MKKTISVYCIEILCEVIMFKKVFKIFQVLFCVGKTNQIFYIANGTEVLPEKLSAKEEFDLVNIMKSGSVEAKNQLIERNLRLVVYTAQKYSIAFHFRFWNNHFGQYRLISASAPELGVCFYANPSICSFLLTSLSLWQIDLLTIG